jgi:myb proto-oncogene protein
MIDPRQSFYRQARRIVHSFALSNDDSLDPYMSLTHSRKDWVALAALFPGRTKAPALGRILTPLGESQADYRYKWTAIEDVKLKDAVQMYGGKDWAAIAALAPVRTTSQCRNRWQGALLDPNMDRANERTGKWTEDENAEGCSTNTR